MPILIPTQFQVPEMRWILSNKICRFIMVTLLWLPLIAVAEPTEGALSGQFSVSPYRKVFFSQGNLRFYASSSESHACADGTSKQGKWRFHEHQYDRVTPGASNTGSTLFGGWMDLFQWASSGYNNRTPWEKYYSGFPAGNLTGENAYYDPGVYNAIENGGNQPGLWRMLTKDELDYILYTRPDARLKWGKGRINNVYGLIILPDEWIVPSGVIFWPGNFSSSSVPIYPIPKWEEMEAAGAVFLPICGCVTVGSTSYSDYNSWGEYHLSTTADIRDSAQYLEGSAKLSERNYSLDFYYSTILRVTCKADMRHSRRHSIRLVQDVARGATPEITIVSEGAEPAYPDTAVDLGLSVRWASFNVGATQPAQLGNQYAWGETTTKTNYTNSNYRFYAAAGRNYYYTKYWYSEYTNSADRDGRDMLEPEDDAATVNWGSNWRMPTLEEVKELLQNCPYTVSTQGSTTFLTFQGIGAASGNSIVVPLMGALTYSVFWSSSLFIDDNPRSSDASVMAYRLSYNYATPSATQTRRYTSLPVRPVCTIRKSHIVVETGSIASEGDYYPGTVLSISATDPEDACTRFVRWSDGDTNRTRTITVEGDAIYHAIYEYRTSNTVTAVPDDPSHGSTAVISPFI